MPAAKIVLVLFRSLLRNAKILDRFSAYKAILPQQVAWGPKKHRKSRDIYGEDISCVELMRSEFRLPRPRQYLDHYIDQSIGINRAVSERVHLLHGEDDQILDLNISVKHISFSEAYDRLRKRERDERAIKIFDQAIELLASALKLLANQALDERQRSRLAKSYYLESNHLYETADAHAYLGWIHYLDDELEMAESHCLRAIELDPDFGNSYNDLGLIRLHQGRESAAIELFEKAKHSPRYAVRHFPNLNLAALDLQHNRVKSALHEYIHALHWMGPVEGRTIRNKIADLSAFLVNTNVVDGSDICHHSR